MPTDILTVKPYFGKTAQPNQTASRTVRQYISNYIFQHGVFESQVDAIIASIEADPVQSAVTSVLDRSPTDYPPIVFNLTMSTVRAYVVKWIDDNSPQAWFRSCFVDD